MHRIRFAGALALAVIWANSSFANEAPLTLAEAVSIAVTSDDPALLSFNESIAALKDQAVADAQLPDPRIRGALANVPTDTFQVDQENMTQVQFTLRQEFPSGRTLSLRGERRQAEADAERARRDLTLMEIRMAVRNRWFEKYYLVQAQANIETSRHNVSELVQALHAAFSAGSLSAQDISRAELELALLDDRITEFRQREEETDAELFRFLGKDALRPLSSKLPILQTLPDIAEMEAALLQHPSVLIEEVKVGIGDMDVALAEQAYRPSWALEGGYGARHGDRADLATIGITLSIPLFTTDRQDRRLSAAVRQRGAAQFDRAAKLLDLRRDLVGAYAKWRRLGERIQLYGDVVIERAKETAEASVSTYASGRSDFAELIRSQLAQLDAELKHMRLATEQGKAWAKIRYLVGEMK
ncbi:MAG: TolC family protein [Parvibaculaceae bacterium]